MAGTVLLPWLAALVRFFHQVLSNVSTSLRGAERVAALAAGSTLV
jgi:hypothetical protein